MAEKQMRSIAKSVARALVGATSFGLAKGEHVTRYTMYKKLVAEFGQLGLGDRVLSISHSTKLCKLLGARDEHIVEANYPEHVIDKLGYPSESFSAVVSDQVFEHISCTPSEAVNECHRVLRPGGIAIHTTCFLTPYHGSADTSDLSNGDFWRFTPSGLALLHKTYDCVLRADGWGNPFVPMLGGFGLMQTLVPEARWHPLNMLARHNRPSYPYVVWVVARK